MAASNYVDFVLVDDRQTLREHFTLLDEGVEAVLAHCPSERLNGADVYTAAINGACELRLVRLDTEVVGFMSTYAVTDLAGSRSLFVWLLYLEPGIPDIMAEVVEELSLVAQENNCAAIEFCTTRAAWKRRLQPHGFEPHCIQFRKEVGHG
jgi:hypothetical protein